VQTRRVLRTTLAEVGFASAARVTVAWVGDGEMRRLNRQTRGKNTTTDVLSFPLTTRGAWPQTVAELGDIVLSVPELRREAKRRGCTLAEEALLLLVHGTLHLLGHDHMRPTERKRMFRLQNTIVSSLGAERVRLPLHGE
jgi:probable rRNA maturation factor